MTLWELEKKLTELDDLRAELNAVIAELKGQNEEKPTPPHPRWKPKKGEKYCFLFGGACAIGKYTWEDLPVDYNFYNTSNVYANEEAAEFVRERRKVLNEMREWAGKWDDEFALRYDENSGLETYFHVFPFKSYGEMRFATKEDAVNCIEAVGEDRIKKYYFMIPEDKSNA